MTSLQQLGLPPLRRLLHAARVLKSVENTAEPDDIPQWEAAKKEYDLALEIAEGLETSGGIHWLDRYECAEKYLELEAAAATLLERFERGDSEPLLLAFEELRQILLEGRSVSVLRLAVPEVWYPVINQLATWCGTSPAGVLEVALRRFARQEGFVLPAESLSQEPRR